MPVTANELDEALTLSEQYPDDLELADAAITLHDAFQENQREVRTANAEKIRGYFQDRETHGLSPENLRQINDAYEFNPEGKAELFNGAWIANTYGLDDEKAWAMQPGLIREYAKQEWGKDIETNVEFADLLKQDYDFEDAVTRKGLNAALSGSTTVDALAELAEENAENPFYKGREKRWRETLARQADHISERLAPHRFVVGAVADILQAKTGTQEEGASTSTESYRDLAKYILDVPEDDRRLVIAAIAAAAANNEAGRKGVIQKLGESVGRGLLDFTENIPIAMDMGSLVMARNQISSATPLVPESAAGDVDSYLAAAGAQLGSRLDPTGAAGISAGIEKITSNEKYVAPSDEVKEQALAKIDEAIQGVRLRADLRNLAENEIDPISSDYIAMRGIYTAARSLPYTAMSVVPGGIALNAMAMIETSYQALEAANPDLSPSQLYSIASIAGPLQAGLEKISGAVLTGKLPAISRLKNQIVATRGGVAGRLAYRAGAATGIEMLQENVQDMTPFLLQSVFAALNEDIPGVDWEERFGEMAENQTELFFAVLPLALFGAGVGTRGDYTDALRSLGNADMLKGQKIDAAEADAIATAFNAGRVDEAQRRFRAAFRESGQDQKALRQTQIEAIPRMMAEGQRIKDLMAQGVEIDILPAIHNTRQGWALRYNDGKQVDFETFDDAFAQWETAASSDTLQLHEDMISSARYATSELGGGRENKFVVSGEAPTRADMVASGDATQEQMDRRTEIAEADTAVANRRESETVRIRANLASKSEQDRTASGVILGSSQLSEAAPNEFGDKVIRTTIRLFQGATPLTIFEETAEGDAKFMIRYAGMRDWMVNSLRAWERDQGDSLFRESAKKDADLDEQDIAEAWGKMVQSYFVGRTKEGDQGRKFVGATRAHVAKALRGDTSGAFTAYAGLFRAVWRRAAMIEKARRDGTLDKSLEDFLAQSTGMSEQRQFERSVAREGAEIADQISGDLSDNETTFSLLPSSESGNPSDINSDSSASGENIAPGSQAEIEARGKGAEIFYRAGNYDESGIKPFASFTRELETAEAYTDNPGFGGDTIRGVAVYDLEELKIDGGMSGFRELAEALEYDDPYETAQDWQDSGYLYPWEESAEVRDKLKESKFNALTYPDDFPSGAETTIFLKDFPNKQSATEQPGASFSVITNAIDSDSSASGENIAPGSQADIEARAMFPESNRLSMLDRNGATWARIIAENPVMKTDPEEVTVFRSTIGNNLRPNDFVALDRVVAESHLANLKDRGETGRIIKEKVKSSDLLMANDATEFIYFPNDLSASGQSGATFSLLPDASNLDAEFASYFSPFQRTPELRMRLGQEMARRLAKKVNEMRPVLAAAKRTKKSVREERIRRQEELFTEKLETIDSTEWAALEASNIDDAGTHPILSDLLRRKSYTRKDGKTVSYWAGSLLSKSAAEKQGMSTRGGEWDGIPDLPPYVWGGTTTPDQAASQFGFESVDEFWTALSREIETWQSVKEQGAEVNRQIADMKREAREEAKAWEEKALEEKERIGTDRAVLLGFLRSLEAITRALPAEVRGKIGGSVALAQLKGPDAMMGEMERRIQKIDVELEKWMKDQFRGRVSTTFKKARAKREAGKRDDGKLGAFGHAWFDYAERVAELSPTEVDGEVAMIEGWLEQGELSKDNLRFVSEWVGETITDEDVARDYLEERLNIAAIMGGVLWGNSGGGTIDRRNPITAEDMEIAANLADDVYTEKRLDWLREVALKRERREGFRAAMIETVGGKANDPDRIRQLKADQKALSRALEGMFDEGLDFASFVEDIYGDSEITADVVSWARKADLAEKDGMRKRQKDFSEFLRRVFPDKKLIARLDALHKMQQPKDIPDVEIKEKQAHMSEMQAIHYTMLGRDPDSREWLDSHGYTQDVLDGIEASLSDQAREIRDWLAEQYDEQYFRINEVYRRIKGVNLPRVAFYAPRLVEHMDTKKEGDIGNPASFEGGMATGFLKRRVQTPKGEPVPTDALAVYWSNAFQIEHYIAFAEVVGDLRATFGHKDVRLAVEATRGPNKANSARQWVADIDAGGRKNAAANSFMARFLQRLQTATARTALAYKVGTLLKQVPAAFASASRIGMKEFGVSFARVTSGTAEIDPLEMLKSDVVQRRIDRYDAEMKVAIRAGRKPTLSAPGKFHFALDKGMDFGMEALGAIDAAFTAFSAAIAYDSHYRGAIRSGLSEEAARAVAWDQTADTVARTAQPDSVINRSQFEISLGIGKLLFMFQGPSRQQFGMQHLALKQVLKNKDMKSAQKLVGQLFVHHVMVGTMMQTMGNLWQFLTSDDDWEEVWETEDYLTAWALGPMTGALWLGPMFDALASSIGGVQRRLAKAPTTASAEFAMKAFDMLSDDDIDIRDIERTLGGLSRAAGGDYAALGVAVNVWRQLSGLFNRITGN